MTQRKAQISFLKKIKDLAPANLSFVHDLADLLHVSPDSAYRRMRGQTDLSLEEALKVCEHYKAPRDIFLDSTDQGHVVFNYSSVKNMTDFVAYLQAILIDLENLRLKGGTIIYSAVDLPLFYHFAYPEHSAFKLYGWERYMLNIDSFENKKFEAGSSEGTIIKLCHQIYEVYQKIDSIEIWTEHTLQGTLKQIEYYFELGLFKNNSEAYVVAEQVDIILKNIYKQSAEGKKNGSNASFELYYSEFPLDNNCILTKINSDCKIYLRHQSMNIMTTQNSDFCYHTENDLKNTMGQSVPLSATSEKQRHQFFYKIGQQIESLLDKIRVIKS